MKNSDLNPSVSKYNQRPNFMTMKFLDMNCVEAAKARIRWCYENYDEVWVSFSGGKDSLVVLTLVEQIHKELGRPGLPNAQFMDEELIADSIVDFVQQIAESGRFNFKWYCLQMYVGFFVMGKHKPFVSWDKSRPWHRQPPDKPYVIYDVGVDTRDHNENTIHVYLHDKDTRVVELTGIRCDESLKRFLSVRGGGTKDVPHYLSGQGRPTLYMGKPIYDWSEMDVFKFFKDNNVTYCSFYDAQMWSSVQLRVASALHERGMSHFMKLKKLAPRFYEQLRALYPEIETHYLYMKETSKALNVVGYEHTFDGARRWAKENLDESHLKEAIKFISGYETRRRTTLEKQPSEPLGTVSLRQVFMDLSGGKFVKAAILRHTITQLDIDYEDE